MRRLVLGTILALGACSKPSTVDPRPSPVTAAAVPPPVDADAATAAASEDARRLPSLPPLDAPAIDTWMLEERTEIRVAVPRGIREKRPVVLGVHGASARAEWACDKWNATLAGFAFVVCPKGLPWWPHQAWGTPDLLAERADRATAALRERYGAYVAEGPVLYGGFSQGGTLASQVVALRPGVYDPIVMVEIGHTPLNAIWAVANFKKGNATRAVVSCATFPCLGFAKNLAWAAKQKDFAFSISEAGVGRGHFFDELTAKTLGPAIAEVTAEDPRWAGLREAVAAKWPDGG
jgi:hypothetical protein